jgi:hypothetical protein
LLPTGSGYWPNGWGYRPAGWSGIDRTPIYWAGPKREAGSGTYAHRAAAAKVSAPETTTMEAASAPAVAGSPSGVSQGYRCDPN